MLAGQSICRKSDTARTKESSKSSSSGSLKLPIRVASLLIEVENVGDLETEASSSGPVSVTLDGVDRLVPSLSMAFRVLELMVSLVVKVFARSFVVDTTRDD